MKFDLHLHTSRHSPDSIMHPHELVRRAVEVGLDGIVITEHDYQWPDDELEELRALAPELVILSGIEVSGRDGDLLVYGATDATKLRRGMYWVDLCREAHAQGAATIAAHPNRWGQQFEGIYLSKHPELDGIEMLSNNMDDDLRRRAKDLRERYPQFACLGNSDGHEPEVVGIGFTEFQIPIRNNADLVRAIQGRFCEPKTRNRRATRC
ncbi:PHP domain-containing protein [Tuwongella immobilis]|uniref:Polymerase/histidinol phosphatase N-terminal domain-containing protein n=1 Tax=Tuwongella immobilis TaxID=692036 RepID=A0A6C2YNG1_9BACT|nr:PHP domain-containing protein [Tuwongella immobilis]VIP03160.1 php domain-containing protein : PHP domain protein OS=Isosphaera pallida (strain ATCC 43644 / DSM 9630 / IS1B) GN=Isop_0831 PE=4 SV=1: PHP: PHP_C [Tuwongella immobilis]VTS03567.1 php domain-containing protein : PHP domain protein OS=Isosphaera pallida (strain ATCC 43644 / DSM 9630 / IS1B) GN=Isop_0831 PE=4 SV=1: PHP: PHP_C [Tuwongella immobilis]